jgi:hypothetical protein
MFCDCSAVKDKEKMCVRRKRGPPGRFRNAANMRALRVCGGPHLNKEDVQGYIKCGRKEKSGGKKTDGEGMDLWTQEYSDGNGEKAYN